MFYRHVAYIGVPFKHHEYGNHLVPWYSRSVNVYLFICISVYGYASL